MELQKATYRPFNELPRISKQFGFTLVELLVVIAIIGVLVSLLLPAIQSAREAARRSQCVNNMHQQSLGMLNYESTHGTLPVGLHGCCYGTWQVSVLPFLEETAMYGLYKNFGNVDGTGQTYYSSPNLENVTSNIISTSTCPSDYSIPYMYAGLSSSSLQLSVHNHVVNIGPTGLLGGNSVAQSHAGVDHNGAPFDNGVPVPLRKITDGLSNTLMLSEVVRGESSSSTVFDVRGLTWWGNGAVFSGFLPPNASDPDVVVLASYCHYPHEGNPPCVGTSSANPVEMYAARSRHTGGVNSSMCDGSVSFISDDIDLNVWRAQSSAAGGEVER